MAASLETTLPAKRITFKDPMLITIGGTYASNFGVRVTISSIAGTEIYYTDEFGCHWHKRVDLFRSHYSKVK